MNSIPNQVLVSFGALALAASTLGYMSPAQALTFNFQFDNTPNGLPLDPPIVGTGTFSFDGNPGEGTFALDSLANFNFAFDINGATFGNADIATPTSDVTVVISTIGSNFSLNFSGGQTGTFGGSLDFINGSSVALSFQPAGGSLYFSPLGSLGTYEAISPVPEPLTMLGASAAIAFGAAFKRRKAQ